MPLFVCSVCPGNPCELRMLAVDADAPPDYCPFGLDVDTRWSEVPPGRSPGAPAGAELIPGPFCEIPAHAIARATAARGRYAIELGGADRLVLAVSRAAFAEAVKAMETVDGLR